MYEDIRFSLMKQRKDQVEQELDAAIQSNYPPVVCRSIWWAMDIESINLAKSIIDLREHENDDIKEVSGIYQEWLGQKRTAD